MASSTIFSRARTALSRRTLAGALAFVAVFGIAVGTAAPAHAGIGLWYVAANAFQSYAELSSTGGDGNFQARAFLGNQRKWGASSQKYTIANATGFSFSYSACLLRNGQVWKCA